MHQALIFLHCITMAFVFGNGGNIYTPIRSIDHMRPVLASLQDLPFNVRRRRSQNMNIRGNVGIIRVSNTGQQDSLNIAITLFEKSNFRVKSILSVKNLEIEDALTNMLIDPNIHIIVCIGGTGISKTDITIETVKSVFHKEINGFGELFRHLTHTKWNHLVTNIGIIAMDTRCTAGIANNKLIFAIPGSPDATTLAIKELIIPGAPTLLGQLLKE